MDIAFEQTWWPRMLARAGSQSDCPHPDWHALRARMIASHEAWRTLQRQRSEEVKAAHGSFDGTTARLIFEFDTGFGRVNRNDSVNRNPGGDIPMAVAGTSRTGGRG